MNPRSHRLFALITGLLSLNSYAQSTQGGGVTEIVNRVPHLRDIYDNCLWWPLQIPKQKKCFSH